MNKLLDFPPVYSFLFFAILTLAASIGCFVVFSSWPDGYSAAGYYVSLLGFGYVLFELFRTKHISEVARANYDRAAEFMREQHYQFCLSEAERALEAALIEINDKLWTHASKSLSSLARYFSLI
jgi:hypothetical protein